MTLTTEIYNDTIRLRDKINKNILNHTRRYALRMLVVRIILGEVKSTKDLHGIVHLCREEEEEQPGRDRI